MDLAESTKWRDTTKRNGQVAEEKLAGLQALNRLAFHVYEHADETRPYPVDTLACLENNSKYLTKNAAKLQKSQVAILSMTPVPSLQSQKSILPYRVSPHGETLMYLFDLDTKKDIPALVVRAFDRNGSTGDKSNYSKNLRLKLHSSIPALDELYRKYWKFHVFDSAEHNAAEWIDCVYKKPELSGLQMDLLASSYDAVKGPGILDTHELLVVPLKCHIAAIAIPMLHEPSRTGKELSDSKVTRSMAQLEGALSGWEHADKGMKLPVVAYHVTPPYQGKCTYLAQGKDECRLLALAAIQKLQENPAFRAYCDEKENKRAAARVHDHTQRLLGVDMSVPLAQQNITLSQAQSH